MEQKYSIISKKKYQHLSLNERIKLEGFLQAKKKVKENLQKTGKNFTTVAL